jgi:hypothetical protein
MINSIRDRLDWAKEQVLPPFSLELVLTSGRSYFIKWIFRFANDDESVTIRIWDLRAVNAADQQVLLKAMNEVRDRDDYDNVEKIHPNLDQGNLHVRIDAIEALVEWHDRIWPVAPEAQSDPQPRRIGFDSE